MGIFFFFFFEVAMLNHSTCTTCSPKNRSSFVLLFFSLTPCINTISYDHNSTDKVLMIHKVRVNSA